MDLGDPRSVMGVPIAPASPRLLRIVVQRYRRARRATRAGAPSNQSRGTKTGVTRDVPVYPLLFLLPLPKAGVSLDFFFVSSGGYGEVTEQALIGASLAGVSQSVTLWTGM